jgi:serralysin
MDGDAGNDVYVVDNAGDVVNEGDGNGIDTVRSTVSFSLANAARVFGDVERLTMIGIGNVNGFGNELANVLTGNNFNNTLDGAAGNDTLRGRLGNDVLRGGAGDDAFVFDTMPNAATNRDTISDFANVAGNNDSFQLENSIFSKLGAAGVLNGNFFHIGAAPADANDFIMYNQGTGALFYDSNANVAGGSVQIATVSNHAALTAADFLVI